MELQKLNEGGRVKRYSGFGLKEFTGLYVEKNEEEGNLHNYSRICNVTD